MHVAIHGKAAQTGDKDMYESIVILVLLSGQLFLIFCLVCQSLEDCIIVLTVLIMQCFYMPYDIMCIKPLKSHNSTDGCSDLQVASIVCARLHVIMEASV